MTITRQLFNRSLLTEIFKPQLLCLNTMHLHTRLTEFLLTPLPALPFLLYGKVNSLMNVLECELLLIALLEISININKDVVCLFCLLDY